jgi:aryl-alcohol dehydrogenase-like predicted oxidoreductase
MEHRPLGRSGLSVSAICLGTMTWGQQNTEAEGHAQIDYALDQGINFLDTAELYSIPPKAETQGSTERVIGSWLASRGRRDRIILATKAIGRSEMSWFRDQGAADLCARAEPEAAADRLCRSLPAALAGAADALGLEPDALFGRLDAGGGRP